NGETVYSIANEYKLPITVIKKQNNLKSNTIFIGQTLTVPYQVQESLQIQETHEVQQTAHIQEAEMGLSEFYTVAPGDTLWNLSERFEVPFTKLKMENRLTANHIQAGQKLYISGKKNFATGKVIGAADNTTVEFYVYGEPLPLKVSHGSSVLFQKMAGKELFITYKNGALISFY
ncbi:MAG TPA: LysM peptidoglycan-binding domain-containing protein, partial [Pseudoneobacillus sp.]|nr:LysM peptidoglycan-binding domain-containing protein [Pseudoneobacillus sp.]